MLHPEAGPEERVPGVGHVAGGVDVRRARPQPVVDHDPVVDGEASRLGQLDPGGHADADDDHVALHGGPVGEADAAHRRRSDQRLDADPEVQVDAVGGVEIAVDPADLRPHDPLERKVGHLDHGDAGAHLPG